MHLVASTLLAFILSPVDWIIILILLSIYTRSATTKKRSRISALIIFLVFSNTWLISGYAKFWQPKPRDISKDSSYSCGILLGGFASPDENDNGYFNSTADRFIQAVKLYKLGKIRYILINGGNGKLTNEDFNEGKWTKGELITMGIPDSVILFEDRSSNTAENAINAKKILDAAGLPPPYLLITSAQHMPRAGLLFKNAGLSTVAFPCSYTLGRENNRFWGIIPKFNVLFSWESYLKETASYFIYKIMKY